MVVVVIVVLVEVVVVVASDVFDEKFEFELELSWSDLFPLLMRKKEVTAGLAGRAGLTTPSATRKMVVTDKTIEARSIMLADSCRNEVRNIDVSRLVIVLPRHLHDERSLEMEGGGTIRIACYGLQRAAEGL